MPRAYADVIGNFRRGQAGAYARGGDYDRAARTVADEPELADSYAAQGERLRRREREEMLQGASRTYAQALAGGDYQAAQNVAAKVGDVAGVTGARGAQSEADQRQRVALWRGAQQSLAELEQIEANEGQGYAEYRQRALDAVQRNPQMNPEARRLAESLPEQWSPRVTNAARAFATRLRDNALTAEQAADLEMTGRQRDIQERNVAATERRADAAERTAEAAMIRAERAGSGGSNQDFNRANSLRDEYNQQTTGYRTIADFAARSEAYLRRAEAGQPSGQGDVGLVYALAKIYDPTSVVREGEFAMVARQGGYGEQMRSWVNMALGRGFSPQIRNQIMAEIRNGVSAAQAQRDQTRTRYEGLAQRAGVDPSLVIDDYQPSGASPAAGGGNGALPPVNQRVNGRTYTWTTRSGEPASGVWNAQTQTFD